MKKVLAFVVVVTMLIGMLSISGWARSVNDLAEEVKFSIPDYHKLDSELVKEIKANGEVVKGKDFKGNGKSYIKPTEGEAINPLDVRTTDAKGIAILVDFPTNEDGSSAVPGVDYSQIPAQKFDDLLNGTEYNPYDLDMFSWLEEYEGVKAPTDRTLKNYYDEVSYEQYGVDIEVVEWVTLPHTYEYYLGQDKGYHNENGDAHIAELVKDALMLADETVDFSQFAVTAQPGDFWLYEDATSFEDENGNVVTEIVPNIFIIHRGTGAEFSRDPEIIWSHKWDILSATYFGEYYKGTPINEEDLKYSVVDGVALNTYNIVPEVGQDISGYLKWLYGPDWEGRKPSPAYPGVYAHEFGHVLGLPDQYDYGYESEGTGMFTLMAGGSYGRNFNGTPEARWYSGNTPVHMNAWDKFYLGFVEPKLITENESITLRPVTEAPDIYKIAVPGSEGREYFLLENRQQEGYDVGLSLNADGEDLHGLVVYHIVDDMIQKKFNRPNEAQNWDINHLGKSQQTISQYGQTHYGFSVIQADGMFDLEKGNNDGDAGDVFPGKHNITSLSSKSSNAANTTSVFKWDTKSTETGINLKNIVEHEDGTITLDVVFTKK